MVTKQEIIKYVIEQDWVSSITKSYNLPNQLLPDLKQELYLILLELEEEKLITIFLSDGLKWWLIRTALNNYYSSTSPFYYKYLRFIKNSNPLDDE